MLGWQKIKASVTSRHVKKICLLGKKLKMVSTILGYVIQEPSGER